MAAPKQPSLRVRFSLEPYPFAAATIYRWGVEALADAELTEGRIDLDGYTDVERSLSGVDGHYQGGSFTFTARDDDRMINGLLQSGTASEFFLNREASLQLLSQAGRAASLAWRTLFRGHITDAQEIDGLKFQASLQDVIGSEFSSLALDKPVARQLITRAAFPNAPQDVLDTPYYIVIGEHSDQGSLDQNGLPNEKGLITLRFLGWTGISTVGGGLVAWPGIAAYAFMNVSANVANGDTVTIGVQTYTFETVFTNTVNKVLIGGTALASKQNLVNAINAGPGSGTVYGAGTTANAAASASIPADLGGGLNTAETIVVQHVTASAIGNGTVFTTTSSVTTLFHEGNIATTTLYGGMDSSAITVPPILPAPTLIATVLGTPGTTRYVYAVSAITSAGETLACPDVVVTTGPATLNGTDKIQLDITPPLMPNVPGGTIIGYRILGRAQTSTHLTILNNGGTWVSPQVQYVDTGVALENSPGAPGVSTAVLTMGNVGSYAMFGGLLGAVKINKLFLSDVGGGGFVRTPPKRIHMAQETLAEALTPHKDDGTPNPRWPHANPWVVRDGVRSTLIYVLGPRAQDAIDGTVTMAVDCCGWDADGDQSGPVVDDAFPALQLMLNEAVLKNGGEGYKDGAFGPLETFENGDAMLRTSAFTAAQTTSATYVTGGYTAAWCISDKSLTLRQFLQKFCLTFDCFIGVNEHGQVYPVLIDLGVTLSTAPQYREHIEMLSLAPPRRAWGEIVNELTYQYDWDTDAARWRNPPVAVPNSISRDAYKGGYRKQAIEGFCTRDKDTIEATTQMRLDRLSYVSTYWTWVVPIEGIEQQLGQIVRLTHSMYGLVDRPVMVVRNRFNPNTQLVTLTGVDVSRVLAATLSVGATMPAVLNFAMSA